MPGLDPGIHDLLSFCCDPKTWMAGSSPAMTGKYLAAHPFRFFAFTAIAAAAVRFSTPSLE